MNEARKPRRLLRRIGAVLAGLVVVGVFDLGIDSILHAKGVYPPWFQPMSTSLWLVAIGYSTIAGVTGGYIAAWLAARRALARALGRGLIGGVLGTASGVGSW